MNNYKLLKVVLLGMTILICESLPQQYFGGEESGGGFNNFGGYEGGFNNYGGHEGGFGGRRRFGGHRRRWGGEGGGWQNRYPGHGAESGAVGFGGEGHHGGEGKQVKSCMLTRWI